MRYDGDTLGRQGIELFGTISASISHEIKNVLAILNENTGLLEDLILLTEKGAPLNIERFKSLAISMKKQIDRGDTIAKNMNQFAHSVDETFDTIDLGEMIKLVVALSRRIADMKSVAIEIRPPSGMIHLTTRPFDLEILIWRCLNIAMANVGTDKMIRIHMEETEKEVTILFSGINTQGDQFPTPLPSGSEHTLLEALSVKMKINDGIISLTLPKTIGEQGT